MVESGTRRANKLGISELISIIQPENYNSINIAKKLGMHYFKSILHQGIKVEVYKLQNQDKLRGPDLAV